MPAIQHAYEGICRFDVSPTLAARWRVQRAPPAVSVAEPAQPPITARAVGSSVKSPGERVISPGSPAVAARSADAHRVLGVWLRPLTRFPDGLRRIHQGDMAEGLWEIPGQLAPSAAQDGPADGVAGLAPARDSGISVSIVIPQQVRGLAYAASGRAAWPPVALGARTNSQTLRATCWCSACGARGCPRMQNVTHASEAALSIGARWTDVLVHAEQVGRVPAILDPLQAREVCAMARAP